MTVRTAAVRGEVSKREAECEKHQPKAGDVLNEREAMAISLAERIALDPHTVTDEFFGDLKKVFNEDEIVGDGLRLRYFQLGQQIQHHDAHGLGPRERVPRRTCRIARRVSLEPSGARRDFSPPNGRDRAARHRRGLLVPRGARPVELCVLTSSVWPKSTAPDWRFVAVNTEAHPSAAEALGVSSLPTLVWFRDGEELERLGSGVTLSSVAETFEKLRR